MPESVMTTSMRGRPSSSSGIRSAPQRRPKLSKRGFAPISASACGRSGPPSDLMLSDPQSTSATERGMSPVGFEQRSACFAPSRQANAVGMRNGSNAWMLRPVGSTSGERIRSPPGTGSM
jgi:hypothetical protein